MYKIWIDASKRREKAVVITKTSKKGEEIIAKKEGDFDLVSTIKDTLEENGLKIEEITEIASHRGPGSFTGLKIGATIANIFNWALGLKNIDQMDIPEYGRDPNITLKKF